MTPLQRYRADLLIIVLAATVFIAPAVLPVSARHGTVSSRPPATATGCPPGSRCGHLSPQQWAWLDLYEREVHDEYAKQQALREGRKEEVWRRNQSRANRTNSGCADVPRKVVAARTPSMTMATPANSAVKKASTSQAAVGSFQDPEPWTRTTNDPTEAAVATTATTSAPANAQPIQEIQSGSAPPAARDATATSAASSSPTSTSPSPSATATPDPPPPAPTAQGSAGCGPCRDEIHNCARVDPQQWPPHQWPCVAKEELWPATTAKTPTAAANIQAVSAAPKSATRATSVQTAATDATSSTPTPAELCYVDCTERTYRTADLFRLVQDSNDHVACVLWPGDCLYRPPGSAPPVVVPPADTAPYGVLFNLPTLSDARLKAAPYGFVVGDKVLTKFVPELGRIQWQVIKAGAPIPAGWGDGGTVK